MAHEEHALATELCAFGRGVHDAQRPLEEAIGTFARRAWSRSLSAEEAAWFAEEARACLAAGALGCETEEQAARWTCVRMIDSAEFALY
jgi:hypothetical protein